MQIFPDYYMNNLVSELSQRAEAKDMLAKVSKTRHSL